MRLFKTAVDKGYFSFNVNEINNLFSPEEGQKYRDALSFYYTVTQNVKQLKNPNDRMGILSEAGTLLSDIQTEKPEPFKLALNAKLEEINAKIEEKNRTKLIMQPPSDR